MSVDTARGTPFCRQGWPKGPPEAPIVTKRAPEGVPERSQRREKSEKNENYDTLILNDPIGVWLHLHPSGEPGTGKKLTKIERKNNNAYEHTKSHKKRNRGHTKSILYRKDEKRVLRRVPAKIQSRGGSMPGPLIVLTILLSLGPWASGG